MPHLTNCILVRVPALLFVGFLRLLLTACRDLDLLRFYHLVLMSKATNIPTAEQERDARKRKESQEMRY